MTDKRADVAIDVSFEIIPVRIVDRGRGISEAVDKRTAVPVENQRIDFRRTLRHSLQSFVQLLLFGRNLIVGHIPNDLGDTALNGLEDLKCMLVEDIPGPFDLAVGDLLAVLIALPCRTAKDQRR